MRAVFLDRDGVLNRPDVRENRSFAPRRVEDFEILPGVAEAVRRLKAAGFLIIVATNQKDVGTGAVAPHVVDEMHRRLRDAVLIDDLYMCTCTDECDCYKPNPGMLLAASKAWNVDLSASYMIGDRWRDVDAGRSAGCRTVFIEWGYDETLRATPDLRARDLSEAANRILAEAAR